MTVSRACRKYLGFTNAKAKADNFKRFSADAM